jgi:dTDP-4-dehydrorhamnose reductase
VILVFGGEGQLGRQLSCVAVERGLPLRGLGRAEADLTVPQQLAAAIRAHAPELVVNAAAYTKVDLAEHNVDDARRANEFGPANLAEACCEAGVPLLHISSDYVFDGRKTSAYLETDPPAPINVYGQTKAAGERAVRARVQQHVILRTAWLYGEFGHNFLKTVLQLAATRDELRIVADRHGNPTCTRDLAEAILAVYARRREPIWGTYHVTANGVTTWHGFATRIVAAQAPFTGRRPRVTAIATTDHPTAAPRPANSALDCTRFEQTFGLRAPFWTQQVDAITRAIMGSQGRRDSHVA